MRYNTFVLSDSIDYAANTTKTVDLPKHGYITQIDCVLQAKITASNTVSANTDALQRLVSSARVTAAGDTYFNVSDGRLWWYWTYFRHRGAITLDSLPSAGSTATVRTVFEIHLGYYPSVPFDPTVVIPTVRLSNPQLEIKWGSASSLGTGYTVDTSDTKMYIKVHELVLEGNETEEAIWPDGLLVPRVESSTESLTATHTNLGLRHDVPVKLVLHNSLIMVEDSSGDRTDTDVTGFGVILVPERETTLDYDEHWYDARIANRKRTEVPSDVAGIYLLEWPLISGDEAGFDLSDRAVGDVQIGISNGTTGGKVHFLHIGYMREVR